MSCWVAWMRSDVRMYSFFKFPKFFHLFSWSDNWSFSRITWLSSSRSIRVKCPRPPVERRSRPISVNSTLCPFFVNGAIEFPDPDLPGSSGNAACSPSCQSVSSMPDFFATISKYEAFLGSPLLICRSVSIVFSSTFSPSSPFSSLFQQGIDDGFPGFPLNRMTRGLTSS